MQHAHVRFLFFYWNGQNNQINDLPFSQMKQCIVSKIYSRDIRCLEVLWGGIRWFTGSRSDNVVDFFASSMAAKQIWPKQRLQGRPQQNNGRWQWGVEKIPKLERSLIHYGWCRKWSPSQHHGPNVKPWERAWREARRGWRLHQSWQQFAWEDFLRVNCSKIVQHWVIEFIAL